MTVKLSAPFFPDAVQLSEQIYVGKDAKDLLILAHSEQSILETHENLVKNILKSVGYNAESEIYLSSTTKSLYNVTTYCTEMGIRKIISFGKKPGDFGFKVKEVSYHLFNIGDLQLIYCDDIETINGSKELKNKLWSAMKEMFNQ